LAADDFALRLRTRARLLVEFDALPFLAAEAEALVRREASPRPARLPVLLLPLFANVRALGLWAALVEALEALAPLVLLLVLLLLLLLEVRALGRLAAEAEAVLFRELLLRPTLLAGFGELLRIDTFRFDLLLGLGDAFRLLDFLLVLVASPFLAPRPSAAPETAPIKAPEIAPVKAPRATPLLRDTVSAASFAVSTVSSARSLTTSAVSARASFAVVTMSFFLSSISLPPLPH
jgi:hypothetical protein